MKRLGIKLFIITLGLVFSTSVFSAELAKEGNGDYRSGKTGTFEVLAMEKERFQMNFDSIGVVVAVPENSPFHNASFRNLGSVHAIKGKWKGSTFVVWTRPNGDKIYGTSEGEGVVGGPSSGVIKFVGGTGTCTGIEGTLEIKNTPGIKPSKDGTFANISVGKINWKIP